MRVFQRVVQQVAHDPFQHRRVGRHPRGIAGDAEAQPLARRFQPAFLADALQEDGQVQFRKLRAGHAGFQHGDVHQRVQQALGRLEPVAGGVHQLAQRRPLRLLADHVQIDAQRLERLAQVVAGRGQEARFGGVGLLRLRPRAGQRVVAAAQFRHAVAVLKDGVDGGDQKQGDDEAGEQHPARGGAGDALLEGAGAGQDQRPRTPEHVDADDVPKGGGPVGRGIEHQRVRRVLFSVVDAVINADVQKLGGALAHDAAHQVVRAEGAVDEAEQRLPAVADADQRLVLVVDRHIDEEAGLDVLVGFLDQPQPGGGRGGAAVAGAFHGGSAARLGVHVEAEGPQVAAGEGLDVDDGEVFGPLPLRRHAVAVETGGVQRRLVLLPVGGLHALGVADGLDAGIAVLHMQAGDVGPPFRAADLPAARVHHRHGALEHLLIGVQPGRDVAGQVAGQRAEARLRQPVVLFGQQQPGEAGQQQPQPEHNPAFPGSEQPPAGFGGASALRLLTPCRRAAPAGSWSAPPGDGAAEPAFAEPSARARGRRAALRWRCRR